MSKAKKASVRKEKLLEGVLQGKTPAKAARDAGFSESYARVNVYRELAKASIQEKIQARIAESQINTNEIIGTLVSHMRGDLADICPKDKFLLEAKKNGVSHLIKELKITERTILGDEDEDSVLERKYEIKIHDSQAAAKSLATIHGLEKVAGKNPADVERERDNRSWAEQQLADFRKDFPELSEIEAKEIIKTQAPSVYEWLN